MMTNGTVDFLQKLQQKHPEANMLVMENANGGLAYYEGNNDDLFEEERVYETVDQVGELKPDGYVVMNNIPVTDEGRPIFEDRFKNRKGNIEGMPGFTALRILRPLQSSTYVVLTQWEDANSFQNWKSSQAFEQAHQNTDAHKRDRPSFSAGPAYVTQYNLVKPH